MAAKHNKWMKILEVVFITFANIFRNLKIAKKEADDKTINNDD